MKQKIDWASQIGWGIGGVVAAALLSSNGYGFHAFAAIFVAILSICWIEYISQVEDRTQAWATFGVVMAALFAWGSHINRRDDRW